MAFITKRRQYGSTEVLKRQAEEEWVIMFRCTYCWAAPGAWCRNASGTGAPLLHVRRWQVWAGEKKRVKDKVLAKRTQQQIRNAGTE